MTKRIDVKKIKKRSDYIKERTNTILVAGNREKTKTGFKVTGFDGKSFETYFENMFPNTSTPLLFHAKKDKVVRILTGVCYASVFKDVDGKLVLHASKRLIAGDEIAFERGFTYRLATSTEYAEMFVCQNSNYEATLLIVEDSGVGADVPDEILVAPSLEERLLEIRPDEVKRVRAGSKAKEQAVALKKGHQSKQVPNKISAVPERAGTVAGLNPKPTGGRFDDAGAG